MKKYELVSDLTKDCDGKTLYRIRALTSFSDVKAGDLGGWIEKEDCLSQFGDAWVYDDADLSGIVDADLSGIVDPRDGCPMLEVSDRRCAVSSTRVSSTQHMPT
jgi:hypothetical protein